MTEVSKALSIIAYYLSEYDMDAVHTLGFKTQKEAFKQISVCFNKDNNYLKLRRDEFDALPSSSSHRNGWRNRPPTKEVVDLANYLQTFSYDELTDLVKTLIAAQSGSMTVIDRSTPPPSDSHVYSEVEIEDLINYKDYSATIRVRTSPTTVRVYNPMIIKQLKNLYRGKCQLCGHAPFPDIPLDLTEAHHIDYFVSSHNNNASNIVILCPNHHRLIHKLNPRYDSENQKYVFADGKEIAIKLNFHL